VPESAVVTTSTTRIGWIGTGVMGASMCGHLLAAGHPVTVTTRTRSKADALVGAGAAWADSPAAVAAASDVVFVMVGYPSEVEDVVLGDHQTGEGGVLGALAAGGLVVDMTTSRPALAVEIASRARDVGVDALDAPVSGGDVGARNGTLSIMVGGDADVFTRARPLLEHLGGTIVHQGPAGAGQHTKLTNQIVVAGNLVAVCEALLYATRAGLDVRLVLESISGGAASSWALSNLAPRILEGDYAPGFFVDHFVKDMSLVLDEAARLQLELPALALVHELATALQELGHGRDGTQSLILALETLSPAS
jgi:3-hydroxyisobutyrate dehydrogenase